MVDSDAKNLNFAEIGLDTTGAMVGLNLGSFNAVTSKVERHSPGRNFFTYSLTRYIGDIKFKASHILTLARLGQFSKVMQRSRRFAYR